MKYMANLVSIKIDISKKEKEKFKELSDQENRTMTSEIAYGKLITGFVEVVLGMKLNEYIGDVRIPAEKAYTDENH